MRQTRYTNKWKLVPKNIHPTMSKTLSNIVWSYKTWGRLTHPNTCSSIMSEAHPYTSCVGQTLVKADRAQQIQGRVRTFSCIIWDDFVEPAGTDKTTESQLCQLYPLSRAQPKTIIWSTKSHLIPANQHIEVRLWNKHSKSTFSGHGSFSSSASCLLNGSL